ncbi:hypothetical protein D3273_24715 [Lichenibacterium minor]|uniref:Uncharacterized protein n=1 Tax=Lichenibacterium minor TaxID=2316528 RepID=A0A4Q2U3J1_9HYPH|nr:hypothetical protein [Lichenibacterium minor]RYC29316.1 hypothetical protein D3273_24715 [Lichenibacterium minor]
MTPNRKLPRLADTEDHEVPAERSFKDAFGTEPTRMSRRRRAAAAADAKLMPKSCIGEAIPIDRTSITYGADRHSIALAVDSKLGPLVQGETFRIAD